MNSALAQAMLDAQMRRTNRILFCPQCGHRLMQRKKAYFSERRFAYRERVCKSCHAVVYGKQPPEEVTGVELSMLSML